MYGLARRFLVYLVCCSAVVGCGQAVKKNKLAVKVVTPKCVRKITLLKSYRVGIDKPLVDIEYYCWEIGE